MDQPLEAINLLKGRTVILTLKGNKEIIGKLIACDLNTNITLEINEVHQLIQGNTVMTISAEQI